MTRGTTPASRSSILAMAISAIFPAMPYRRTARWAAGGRVQRSSAEAALVTAEAMKSGGKVVRAPCQRGTEVLLSRTPV